MLFKRKQSAAVKVPTSTRDSNSYLIDNLRTTGISFNGNSKLGLFRIVKIIILCSYFMIYLPLSFLINYVLNLSEFTPGMLLQSIQHWLNCFCWSIKLITVIIYGRHLEEINKCFDDLDTFCIYKWEQLSIDQMVSNCKNIYNGFISVYFCFCSFNLIDGLYHGRPPFNIFFPYINWHDSEIQLFIQTFLEYFSIGYMIYSGVAIDSLGVIIIQPLRRHLYLLKARMKRLGEMEVDLDCQRVVEDVTHAELVKCIKAHKIMIHLYDVLRPLISIIIFIQFIMCGSILGIATINIVVFADSSTRLGILAYMFAVLMQSFPLCYYCNCLIDDCNDLANAMFHSSWYQQDQRYKKTLLQFLQKLQKPIKFRAMNIFDVNLATNINVAKFAFTVYAIAQGMNLSEKLQKL